MEKTSLEIKERKEKEVEIKIEIPTKENELDRIKATLEEIQWYKEKGYYPNNIILPEYYHKIAEKILAGEELSEVATSEEMDRSLEYSEDDYAQTSIFLSEKIDSEIDKILENFNRWKIGWGFKTFKNYSILLTKYGTGGSYNYYNGNIILRIDQNNIFSNIIHELVHIGIEEVIIKKYNLTHWEKERIVDLICKKILNIPGYSLQNENNKDLMRLDEIITSDSINNFPKAIEKYLQNKSIKQSIG